MDMLQGKLWNQGRLSLASAVACVACAAAAAPTAHADFTGYVYESALLPSGRIILNVYARFSHANDRVLAVYNASTSTTSYGGFHQVAEHPFWKPDAGQAKLTSDDSWVAIGTNPNGSGTAWGGGGVVAPDSNFVNFDDANGSTDFSVMEGTGGGAGWYNGNFANSFGYAFDEGRVLLAHLVVNPPAEPYLMIHWNFTLIVYLNGATASTSGIGTGNNTWGLPAPGAAIPLAALAALARSRRRV